MNDLVTSPLAKVGDRVVTIGFASSSGGGFAFVENRDATVRLLPGTELRFDRSTRYFHNLRHLRFGGQKVAWFLRCSTDESGAASMHLSLRTAVSSCFQSWPLVRLRPSCKSRPLNSVCREVKVSRHGRSRYHDD